MKKIVLLVLALALCFAVAACGSKDAEDDEGGGPLLGDSVDTDTGGGLSEALAWWNSNFYGYWTVTSVYGALESLEDGIWDCYAVIDVQPDGSGTVYIWDDDDEMGTVEIQIDELGGIASMGSATSEGGVLFGMPVKHADWVMMPTYDGYEDYWGDIWPGDYMEIDAYCDMEDGDSISYKIVLRPWGILWEDVPEDNRPPYYENWYKNAGFYEYATILDALEATNSATNEGTSSFIHSALTGGTPAGSSSNNAPSDSGASEPIGGTSGGAAVILDLTNAELNAKWDTFTDEVYAKDSKLSGITYESVVKLLGVEGEKTEDRDGFVEYRWYASDEGSLSIRWNTESGEWINSAMNQYGRP